MIDETLTNFIKQSTQQKGKKKEQREKTPIWTKRAKTKEGH